MPQIPPHPDASADAPGRGRRTDRADCATERFMTEVPVNLPMPVPRGVRLALAVARIAAALACLTGLAVLLTWRFKTPALSSFLSSFESMRPDAALAVTIGGLALLCFTWRWTRPLSRVLALPVIGLAILALGYDPFYWHPLLNQLLIDPTMPNSALVDTQETVRMALGIGVSLILFALALLTAATGRAGSWFSQFLGIVLLVQVLIVLTGYAYGITSAYYPFPFSALSVDGAASALLLGLGLVAATPEYGLSAAIVERSPAGEMLRRLLPGILILPLVTGWFAHQAEMTGFYGSAATFAIFAVVSVVLLAAFALATTDAIRAADRDRAEALLEQRREREWLQITLASIGDGVIAADAQGTVLIVNKVAEELTGWSEADAKGRPIGEIFQVIDGETRKAERDPAMLALEGRQASSLSAEALLLTRDGREIPIQDSGAPIFGADGSITGAVLIFRDVTAARRAGEQQSMLVRELNHRVKNVLAIVQSLVHASMRQTESPAALAMAETLGERLRALHRAHDLLLEAQWSGASLKAMVERELEPYCREDGPTITMKGPDVLLPPSCTSILAMTLHELATNAVKYGSLSQNDGKLDVAWRMGRARRLRFTWRERGTDLAEPGKSGFGMQLIDRGIRHNLGGETKLEFRAEGLYVMFDVPLEPEAPARPAPRRQITQAETV
jgi:PAS domain S-box-containing protein